MRPGGHRAEVRYRASGARTAQRRPNRLTSIQSAARLATAWTTRSRRRQSPVQRPSFRPARGGAAARHHVTVVMRREGSRRSDPAARHAAAGSRRCRTNSSTRPTNGRPVTARSCPAQLQRRVADAIPGSPETVGEGGRHGGTISRWRPKRPLSANVVDQAEWVVRWLRLMSNFLLICGEICRFLGRESVAEDHQLGPGGLGAFLLVTAVVASVWAPDQVKRAPLDTDSTTRLSGTAQKLPTGETDVQTSVR